MSDDLKKKMDELLMGFYNFEKKTDENFSKMDSKIDGLENKINNLESRMDNLENRMDSLENRMDSLENRMNSLETKVDDLEIKMDSRFDNVEKSIRSIKGIVGENMSDIADINRRLGKAK